MRQIETSGVEHSDETLFDKKSAFMSPREVAELLGVSRRTIYRWLRTRELPSVKVAGTRRISRDEVAKLTGREEDIHAKSVL